MAYIGQQGGVTSTITSKTLDTMTGDGSDTTLTLSQTPTSAEDVSIYADGVYQRPTNEYTVSGDVVTFTTAPASGVFVCAVTGGGHHIGSPMGGSVTTSKIIDGTITNAMVATMSSSKLTGALGALDGSALTGIPSTITKSANDPAIDTNPSGGLGTVWANTTSGEMFMLTDATAGANVWTNVGAGTGDVEPWVFQGTVSGYSSGGYSAQATIEKNSFASDGNATSTGNLSSSRYYCTGASSKIHGYTAGGHSGNKTIDKFSFASEGDATDVGDFLAIDESPAGSNSETYGYGAGEYPATNVIEKYSFSVDGNATDVGNLSASRYGIAGISGTAYGYATGGSGVVDIVDKFSFASDGNATDICNLTSARQNAHGNSSTTEGFTSGGYAAVNIIDKFSFASEADAVDHGDLSQGRGISNGPTSTTHGYTCGGSTGGSGYVNTIDKYAMASNSNATDVGDLTGTKSGPGMSHI